MACAQNVLVNDNKIGYCPPGYVNCLRAYDQCSSRGCNHRYRSFPPTPSVKDAFRIGEKVIYGDGDDNGCDTRINRHNDDNKCKFVSSLVLYSRGSMACQVQAQKFVWRVPRMFSYVIKRENKFLFSC